MMAAFHLGEPVPGLSFMLTHWLSGTPNGMEPSLMIIITPVLFLLRQVKMSASEKRVYPRKCKHAVTWCVP